LAADSLSRWGVAHSGGEALRLVQPGDAVGVKCLVAAVNVVGNGGDCGALPGLRHDDRVRGAYPSAVNRRVADPVSDRSGVRIFPLT